MNASTPPLFAALDADAVAPTLWEGRTLAMEFSWEYESRQYCGQWAFPMADARRSPGQVLLRHSVLQALDRGVTIYDQGLGDQDYKFHLPSRTVTCTTWGLFPGGSGESTCSAAAPPHGEVPG